MREYKSPWFVVVSILLLENTIKLERKTLIPTKTHQNPPKPTGETGPNPTPGCACDRNRTRMSQSDVRARLRPFGIVFEKSLTDLIRGIRANKEPEAQAKFLQNAIEECRKEVRAADMDVKTMAILKLAYLEMYGFDMSWANFHVLEVMSSSKFQQKRVGYLAAIQAFRNDNDVLMLTTNLLKKDLNSGESVEVGVALSGISTIVTTALASDITDDIIKMLNHSKPYIRKKAVLTMYKIFLKYPDALRSHLQRLCDKLDDPDETVVTATVTVICELSKKTPKLLVGLAPQLYNMLNTSSNNWMLIRLLKLFASLAIVEPRLKGKLLNPLLDLMSKTRASSLVYECVNCLVTGNMIEEEDYQIADTCLEELVQFFKGDDSNLKYVGLLAFYKIGKINSKFIGKYSDVIMDFLEDDDVTIREKALELVHGIVDDENLFQIVKSLMVQLVPEDEKNHELEDPDNINSIMNPEKIIILSDKYKTTIVKKILEIASHDNFANIPSFEWYLAVISDLVDLSIVNNLQTGSELGEQLRDIAVRVPSIRKDVIAASINFLNNEKVYSKLPQLLTQVVWITGEHSSYIKNGDVLIQTLVISNETDLLKLDPSVLAIFIPAIIKIYNNFVNKDSKYWDNRKKSVVLELTNMIVKFLEKLTNSKHFEIQERSVEFLEFLKLIIESIEDHDDSAIELPGLLTTALPSLFNSWELNPISSGSQRKIQVPSDLDLDSPIDEEIFDEIDNSEDEESSIIEEFEEGLYEDHGNYHGEEEHEQERYDDEQALSSGEIEARKKERMERLKDDPYYLSSGPSSQVVSPKLKSTEFGRVSTSRSVTPSVELEEEAAKKPKKIKKKKNVVILRDEVVGDADAPFEETKLDTRAMVKKKKNLLTIDSSNLDNFDINKPVETEVNGSYEIAKIREQLMQQEENSEPQEEEVIVIRKKKDKKKKKVDGNGDPIEKKKKKKTKKKVAEIEGADGKEPEGPSII